MEEGGGVEEWVEDSGEGEGMRSMCEMGREEATAMWGGREEYSGREGEG